MRLVVLQNVASRKVEQLILVVLRKPVQKITNAIITDLQKILTAWLLR